MNHGYRGWEEIQNKGIEYLFNTTVAENFSSLKKGRDIQVQRAFRKPNQQNQRRNTSDMLLSKTSVHGTKKELWKPLK
jgi:hypothetical protein